MNLQQYADHRAALGLSGTSRVAVLDAIKDGRLGDAAVQTGRSWKIDAARADALWAGNTHPLKGKPIGGNTGGRPRHSARAEGAKLDAARQAPRAAADSQQINTNYQQARGIREVIRAKREQLGYETDMGTLVPRSEIKVTLAAMVTNLKNRLRAMGNKLAPELELQDASTCQGLVDSEVDEALLELSKWEPA